MRVVLLRDVPNLGKAGEVREIADGYGRNFLIPRKLALLVTRSNLAAAKAQRQAEAVYRERSEAELGELAQQLEGLSVNIRAKVGAEGRFYGSVTSADIAKEVARLLGREFNRKKIELKEPIRQLGNYEVPVRLAGGVVPKLKVIVEEEES